jgi:hypothetical protein
VAVSTRRRVRHPGVLAAVVVAAVLLIWLGGFAWWRVLVALGACYLIFRIGLTLIGSFARPIPEPPPPGELRRVRLNYRCSLCGTEVRMTVANDEMPTPPRHCQEDMELVAPIME